GVPKAATLGREAFAAQLDRGLAAHGVITMDALALRRLDRVDALVLHAAVATSDRWSIDEIVPVAASADPVECALRARSLLDSKNPRNIHSRGAWTVAPLADAPFPVPRGTKARGRLIAADGRGVLGLWRGDDFRAFVAVVEEPADLVEELIEVGGSAGLEIFLSGGTDAFARRVNVSGRLSIGELEDEVRALQAAGRVAIV